MWIICKCSALDVFTDISLSDSKWLCFILFAWRDRKLLVNCLFFSPKYKDFFLKQVSSCYQRGPHISVTKMQFSQIISTRSGRREFCKSRPVAGTHFQYINQKKVGCWARDRGVLSWSCHVSAV